MSTVSRQMDRRTRNVVRDNFFIEDDNVVRLTAKNLLKALADGQYETARYELETLAQAHTDLENSMDEIAGQEPVEGDEPVSDEIKKAIQEESA